MYFHSTMNVHKVLILIFNQILLIIGIDPVVKLPNGEILGSTGTTLRGTFFYSFYKIPYARPPIGDLRFMPPEVPQNWNGTLNCTILDKMCYQISKWVYPLSQIAIESEDCLFLNVFTTKIPQKKENGSLPVMFFIHGGGFTDGNSEPYKPHFFMDNDVILVTINYRLGVFGFLSTQDKVIKGNMGLKDQQLAIKWTQQNIHLFGGDPKKITIFGHSAGAAAVSYHLLNPKSEGLFWAAIIQSGSALSTWAHQKEPRKVACTIASLINKTFTKEVTSNDLLQFFQGLTAEEIVNGEKLYENHIFRNQSEDVAFLGGQFFTPVIEQDSDDAFVTRKTFGMLDKGEFVKVPLMIGFVSEENLNFHTDPEELKRTSMLYDSNLEYLIPVSLSPRNLTETGILIRNMYTNGEPFIDNLGATVRFSSDNGLVRPVMKEAEFHSKHSKTYFYKFSFADGPLTTINASFLYNDTELVPHGGDMECLFCLKFSCYDIKRLSKSDQVTRERMLKLWTNFAKFRNPTPEPSEEFQNVTWPVLQVDNDTFPYLDIGYNLEVKNFPKKEIYKKWGKLYEVMNKDDMYTY